MIIIGRKGGRERERQKDPFEGVTSCLPMSSLFRLPPRDCLMVKILERFFLALHNHDLRIKMGFDYIHLSPRCKAEMIVKVFNL
jgi:hypothetical protein